MIKSAPKNQICQYMHPNRKSCQTTRKGVAERRLHDRSVATTGRAGHHIATFFLSCQLFRSSGNFSPQDSFQDIHFLRVLLWAGHTVYCTGVSETPQKKVKKDDVDERATKKRDIMQMGGSLLAPTVSQGSVFSPFQAIIPERKRVF